MIEGHDTVVYAFYDGRPDAQTIAALMHDIESGKAVRLMRVGADSKNITITMPPDGK